MEEHAISGFNLGESEEAKVEVEDTENLAHDERHETKDGAFKTLDENHFLSKLTSGKVVSERTGKVLQKDPVEISDQSPTDEPLAKKSKMDETVKALKDQGKRKKTAKEPEESAHKAGDMKALNPLTEQHWKENQRNALPAREGPKVKKADHKTDLKTVNTTKICNPEIDNPKQNKDNAKDIGKYAASCKIDFDLWQVNSDTILYNGNRNRDTYGNTYGNAHGNAQGNAYRNAYGNAYGNAYKSETPTETTKERKRLRRPG